MRELKPIPTEYRGVKYRSKSEAIIARCFDIVTEENVFGFSYKHYYENEFFRLKDGYIPDFVVQAHVRELNLFTTFFVEYKPSRPTDTYLELAYKRGIELGKILKDPFGVPDFVIAVGSPFSNDRNYCIDVSAHSLDVYDEYDPYTVFSVFMNKLVMDEAKKYRFDLASMNRYLLSNGM